MTTINVTATFTRKDTTLPWHSDGTADSLLVELQPQYDNLVSNTYKNSVVQNVTKVDDTTLQVTQSWSDDAKFNEWIGLPFTTQYLAAVKNYYDSNGGSVTSDVQKV